MARTRAGRRQPAPGTPATAANSHGGPRAALAIAAALLLVGAYTWWMSRSPAAPPQAGRPDVILITLDTTRADRLGSYGYASAATPNLDRLAAQGVRFAQALSPAPLTLPAHASLLTGRQPYTHGVRNNGHFVLAGDVPTLAEALSAAGYETAAFVSSFVLDRQFGLARGFSHYDDGLDPAPAGVASVELERRGDRTVAAARAWLAARSMPQAPPRPFFLWVHLYDPHDPYVAPAPYRDSFRADPYSGEIAFDDAQVGALLQTAGASGALVVVTGDHGESLGEHGESTHGLFVYESALRVPLIIAGAGVAGAAVVEEPVRLVDVGPTILDLTGVTGLAGADGRSLRPLMEGRDEDGEPPPVYAETYFPQFFMGWAPLRSMRAGRWKYIDAPEPELYDLSSDPSERTNLVAREPAAAGALKRVLESSLRPGMDRVTPAPITAEARERLASLGYVSQPVRPAPAGTAVTGADPKRMVTVFERLLDGNRALASGREADALRIANDVLGADGGNAFARLLRGRAALALGRDAEALAAFQSYLALVPGSADAHHWAALAALRMGDRTRALAEEEAALALDPGHTSAIVLRAGLLLSAGRADEGIASVRDAIRAHPDDTRLPVELADLLVDARRFDEAEPEYRRVLARDPRHGRALTGLGLLLAATGRLENALETLTRALDADALGEEARFARAEVLEQLGRAAEARADYRELLRPGTRPDLRQLASARLAELR